MPELFEAPASLPPREQWLLCRGLIVRDYQRHEGGWSHDGLNTARFLCANRAMTRYASGDTEDAAEQAYAVRYGLTWWKLADWNGAMTTPHGEWDL